MVEQSEQVEREIAHGVLARIFIETPKETDQMHIYRDGIYIRERFDSTIKQLIKEVANNTLIPNAKGEFSPYHLSISRQNMIIDFIKSFSYSSLDDFDSNERIINTEIGLYYLDGYEYILPNPRTEDGHYEGEDLIKEIKHFISHEDYISKHDKPYKSFIQIPVKYDPKAENLEIDQIFSDIFGFETVPLIYEMIAYLLLPHTQYGKAFMFYGQTGTGKTTAINIITQFIGYKNISGIELQKLDDKFELEKTRNKLINIFDDLSNRPLEYVGNFKKLVTNTWLYGRIKFLQSEIKWKNRCKGLFACNILPKIKEYVTNAFYTRWVLIPCFNDMKELGIKKNTIREKKYSQTELSGLFNKIIQALKRLEERGGFPEEWQDIDYVKNYWNMDINPVAIFIEECCEKGESYEVNYEQFYHHLNKFRKEKRVKQIKKRLITISLKKLGIEKIDKGSKVPKERRYCYSGIEFKTDYVLAHEDLQKLEPVATIGNYLNGDY